MTPWWSQAWIDQWGPALFNCVFWPLTCLGTSGMQQGRSPRWVCYGAWALACGIMLGLVLLGLWLAAVRADQPGHVREQLGLFGGLLTFIHGSLLVGLAYSRRTRTGGRP